DRLRRCPAPAESFRSAPVLPLPDVIAHTPSRHLTPGSCATRRDNRPLRPGPRADTAAGPPGGRSHPTGPPARVVAPPLQPRAGYGAVTVAEPSAPVAVPVTPPSGTWPRPVRQVTDGE